MNVSIGTLALTWVNDRILELVFFIAKTDSTDNLIFVIIFVHMFNVDT
jgi:hypothetical protein